jgi:hypothetical protein
MLDAASNRSKLSVPDLRGAKGAIAPGIHIESGHPRRGEGTIQVANGRF